MRVHGFDLLRGLCALAVASYHMLMWTDTVTLHSCGLFGVYIFFVLSGASLVVAYQGRFAQGFPASKFLLLRFVRLAPLYILVVAIYAAHHVIDGTSGFLNLSFLFGLGNPGKTSVVTGGWSLGIEFVFYLMFPVILSLSLSQAKYWIGGLLVIAQLAFVQFVLKGGDFVEAWTAYTQPLSFIAYFYLGCLIANTKPQAWSAPAFIVALGLILAGSGAGAVDTLTGFRGIALCALSVAVVYFSAGVVFNKTVCSFLGDVSYGVYLFHPIVYAVLKQASFPVVILIPAGLALSMLLAYASYKLYESPIRALVNGARPKEAHGVIR